MKKLMALILAGMLVLTACGSNSSTNIKDSKEYKELESRNVELVKQTEELKSEIEKLKGGETSYSEPESKEETKTQAATSEDKGTRQNPYKLEDKIQFEGDYSGTPMSLSDLVRGKDAIKRAKKENQFNKFSDKEEPIFFKVDFKLNKYQHEEDDYFWISDGDFVYYKSDFSENNTENYVSFDNGLGAKLYEGGNTSGYVAITIPKDDNGYLLFKDNFWIKLYK